MEYYTAERKKGLLGFIIAWMELASIMLSEISQVVKDKYHMISPIERNLMNTNKLMRNVEPQAWGRETD